MTSTTGGLTGELVPDFSLQDSSRLGRMRSCGFTLLQEERLGCWLVGGWRKTERMMTCIIRGKVWKAARARTCAVRNHRREDSLQWSTKEKPRRLKIGWNMSRDRAGLFRDEYEYLYSFSLKSFNIKDLFIVRMAMHYTLFDGALKFIG